MTLNQPEPAYTWTIFIEKSYDSRGSSDGIILENGADLVVEVSFCFELPTTNNQTEYETIILRIPLATNMGVENIKIRTNFFLVVSQVKGET